MALIWLPCGYSNARRDLTHSPGRRAMLTRQTKNIQKIQVINGIPGCPTFSRGDGRHYGNAHRNNLWKFILFQANGSFESYFGPKQIWKSVWEICIAFLIERSIRNNEFPFLFLDCEECEKHEWKKLGFSPLSKNWPPIHRRTLLGTPTELSIKDFHTNFQSCLQSPRFR